MERKEDRKKRGWLATAVLAAILALAGAIALCPGSARPGQGEDEGGKGGMVVDTRATRDGDGATGGNPLAGRSVYFSGIGDAAIGRDTAVRLDNREENLDFLMRYEVYDTGTGGLVFETGLIPSGRYVDWVPGVTLGPGEYTLDFLQIPYCPGPSGGYTGLTQGSNRVTLAITD